MTGFTSGSEDPVGSDCRRSVNGDEAGIAKSGGLPVFSVPAKAGAVDGNDGSEVFRVEALCNSRLLNADDNETLGLGGFALPSTKDKDGCERNSIRSRRLLILSMLTVCITAW